jgi:hypothetical protein
MAAARGLIAWNDIRIRYMPVGEPDPPAARNCKSPPWQDDCLRPPLFCDGMPRAPVPRHLGSKRCVKSGCFHL